MPGNQFGSLFSISTFGESHGKAIGGIIEGCPAGLNIDLEFVQSELDKRRPGSTDLGTKRNEADQVEFLSGIFEGKSTGTPIGFIIANKDARSKDYSDIKDIYRPSHADFTFENKYGIRDYKGGGRSSARETACRVVGGAIAKLILKDSGVSISAFVSSIGEYSLKKHYSELDLSKTYDNEVRCPDAHIAEFMIGSIEKLRKDGDSVGGIVTCVIQNTPIGLGEPVFDKLQAQLAGAMLSINAVKGFEYGRGFESAHMTGSEHNDEMRSDGDKVVFETNNSGGIQGGISNGEDIYFNVAFKPVASISKSQKTVNKKGEEVEASVKGRHDPCVVPRAVPIVEAMAALVLADALLIARSNKM